MVVICDSLETDGRFLLYSLVTTTKRNVLWLGCTSTTSKQIATALKKMGSETANAFLKKQPTTTSTAAAAASTTNTTHVGETTHWNRPLHIHSLMVEISERVLIAVEELDAQLYLKDLYQRVQLWIQSSSSNNNNNNNNNNNHNETSPACIVLDDVSALATLVGQELAYCFVTSLRAACRKTGTRFLLRCWQTNHETSSLSSSATIPSWIGAGGRAHHQEAQHHGAATTTTAAAACLVELADQIMDVIPLATGYSREAHGKLVVTTMRNRKQVLVVNYCLQDTTVSAIRLL
jgi:hypothetical protein